MGNVSEAYNDMMQGDAPANWVRPSITFDVVGRARFTNDMIFLIAGKGQSYTSGLMNLLEEAREKIQARAIEKKNA